MVIFVLMKNRITSIIKYKPHLVLLFLASFWVVLLNYVLNLNQQSYIFPDSFTYIQAAEKWYLSGQSDATRPLLIAMINGTPLAFGYTKEALFSWSLAVNTFAWMATLLFLFEILRKQCAFSYAFGLTIIYLVTITSTLLIFHLLTETIFIFGLITSLFCFQNYFSTKEYRFLAIAIGVLLACLMIKPSVKLALLFLVIYFLKILSKHFLNKWTLVILVPLFLLIFHVVQVHQQFGNYTITYTDSKTYYNYLGARADCLRKQIIFEEYKNPRAIYFDKLTLPQQKNAVFFDLKEQIKTNKWNLFKAYFINVFGNSTKGNPALINYQNWSSTTYFDYVKLFFRAVSKVQNCIFSLAGILLSMMLLLRKNRNELEVITSIFVLYFIAISGISSGQGDRFHVVIYPLVLVLISVVLRQKNKN